MLMTKNGLPKHCSWATDRHGKRRVRFRRGEVSTYLQDEPWSETFMRQYANALGDETPEHKYTSVMHRQTTTSGAWEHWQLARSKSGRWRRARRTKCVADFV